MLASTGSFQFTSTSRLVTPARKSRPSSSLISLRSRGHGVEVVDQRRRRVVQVDEHQWAPRLATDRGQGDAVGVDLAEVLGVGIADETAVEVVDPAVVRARHAPPGVALGLDEQRRPAVLAGVGVGADLSVAATDDDQRLGEVFHQHVVAGVADLIGVGDVQPRPSEHEVALERRELGGAVPLRGHRRQVGEGGGVLVALAFAGGAGLDLVDLGRAQRHCGPPCRQWMLAAATSAAQRRSGLPWAVYTIASTTTSWRGAL